MEAAFLPAQQHFSLHALAAHRQDGNAASDSPATAHASAHVTPLQRLRTPVWLYDIDQGRVLWANEAALGLWCSDSLEELRQRDMAQEMSPTIA